MIWNIKRFDINKQAIVDYNPLDCKYYEGWIKQQKKRCATKTEFAETLRSELQHRFWSRSEYELIIIREEDGSIWLSPWVGCSNPDEVKINVTDDTSFDWKGFAEEHIDKQIYGNRAKIDVYDQLQWRWSELVDYIWHTRLKWERDHPKFHEE
jgi:hypothetical protein